MKNNYKNLKLYKGLTNISPLFFELKMKLECDYNFFNRAAHSLKFTSAYGLEISNVILNINRKLKGGLDLYAKLPSVGQLDVFCQIILKIAIFHGKLLPFMLADLFKAYPLVGPELIEFSALELALFDAGIKLPKCIDELYIIMLEKGGHYTMQRDESGTGDPYVSFDVDDPSTFNKRFESYLQHLQKKHLPIDNSNIVGLYEVKLVNIPYMVDLISYLTQNKEDTALFFVSFAKSMEQISIFTNQLLLVNSFFDFLPKREYYKKDALTYSPEKEERMKKFYASLNIKKQIRPYKNYEEYALECIPRSGPKFSYPGD